MHLAAFSDGRLSIDGRITRCAIGRGGIVPATAKLEGDRASPAGLWPLRRAFWRSDRAPPPSTRLPLAAIAPTDGWCDAPGDEHYNRLVTLPYTASAESLWRVDRLYDLVIVLGHNDDPVIAGAGSAIFLHLARDDFAPTDGCIATGRADLLDIVSRAGPNDVLRIAASSGAS